MFCEKFFCKFFNLMDIKLSDILKRNCLPERLILPKSKFYYLLEWQVTANVSFASAFSGRIHKMSWFTSAFNGKIHQI